MIDPATENRIGEILDATAADIAQAVSVANAAQRAWRGVNYHRRAELLHEVSRRVMADRPRVAEMLTREMGKPYKESFDEVAWSASAIDYYAEIAAPRKRQSAGRRRGRSVSFHDQGPARRGGDHPAVQLSALPVCAGRRPPRSPSGNAVIIKPSDLTTLTTLQFVDAFDALPAGARAGDHRRRRRGPATGRTCPTPTWSPLPAESRPAGASRETCGRLYKRALIETSGNDPFIVMPSAPVDIAARGAAFGAFLNCGQVCAAAERFYVHEQVYSAFIERLVHHTSRIRVGNGLDRVDMGPLASQRELQRYLRLLDHAHTAGAAVLTGGGRPAHLQRGWFVEPTVLGEVSADAPIMNDETFGPVAPVCIVQSFDEALMLANRSRYGLGATVYTTNLDESMRGGQ